MRAPLALLIALIAVTAGCIGSDEPVDSASTTDAGGEGAAAEPESPTTGGSTSTTDSPPPATTTTDAPPGEEAPAVTERTVLVDWSAMTPFDYCIPAGPNSCITAGSPDPWDGETYFKIEVGGEIRADLELAWTSIHPLDAQMQFIVLNAEVTENGWSGTWVEFATGVSPLKVSFEGLDMEPGYSLMLVVRPARITPDPVFGYVSPGGTEFTVTGSVIERA